MWQICIASGNVEAVVKESSDLIPFNFNEGADQKFCLKVKCLITNATRYDVFIGQEALFPLGFIINNWFEHACYQVDWETNGVATLTWPSVGVKPNTWKSWGFEVLRDSRMFRAQQQDPKHLALGCSWCHWKGLET